MRRQFRTRAAMLLATAFVVALPASSAIAARSALTISPKHYNFGRVAVGTTETATLTVTNTSSEFVAVTGLSFGASSFNFAFAAGTCAGEQGLADLSPGETCTYVISFAPMTEQGRETATFCLDEPVEVCTRLVGQGRT